MLHHRPSEERGAADFDWLHAKHTFSFSEYHDPKHMGFRSLRVINEDRIEAKEGFPTHGHKDMEIITYVISGALEHKDSMGNGSIIRPGEVQYMSAGNGVRHSEFNHESNQLTHLLQIWIIPDKKDCTPAYDQIKFSTEDRTNRLHLVVSGEKTEGAIHVRQDAKIYASLLEPGKTIEYKTSKERGLWLQLVRGKLNVNGQDMTTGDGLAVEDEQLLKIESFEAAEFLLFDLR